MTESKSLAVFDFDDTLIDGDSLWIFFALVAGWPAVIAEFAKSVLAFAWTHFVHQDDRARVDRGTFLKQQMLNRLIRGRGLTELKRHAQTLRHKIRWNETMRAAVQDHIDRGHRVVIASGSLDIYLYELLKDLPHHHVLCTEIGAQDDRATGEMTLGNCVRAGKALRVAAYVHEQGPFAESWGYGNYPDDVPMMNLLKHRIIV